jgi:aspartate aminotransferase
VSEVPRTGTELARRVQRLQVSPTVAVAQRAAALRAKGIYVFDFTVGEPDQDTPAHVAAAGIAAIEAGRTRYTASAGLAELRAAIVGRYRKDFKVAFSPEEALVTVGAKQAVYLAAQALLDRGDEAVIPAPYWPTFCDAVRLAGARAILVPAQERDGFKVTARMIGKATSPRTKLVILNSPNNPTGAVIDPEELLVIGDMAQRRRFTVLLDDTYGQLLYQKFDHSVFQALRDAIGDRFLIAGSTSKAYCMTGWRVGWLLGPGPLVEACAAQVSHSTQGPATFAQLGAVEALNGPQRCVQGILAEYRRRRDAIHPVLAGLPKVTCIEPEGAFYLFPNVARHLTPAMPTTLDFAERLLEDKGVAVVPGEAFGSPGHVRISFARPLEDLKAGVKRLGDFLQDPQGERPRGGE